MQMALFGGLGHNESVDLPSKADVVGAAGLLYRSEWWCRETMSTLRLHALVATFTISDLIVIMSGSRVGITDDINWETCESPVDGMVSSGSGVSLFFTGAGGPRSTTDPVVIFEAGHGASGASWAAVQRLLDKRIRSYRYDRAGYGRSPPSQTPRSAAGMANELLQALRSAGIAPPYILAAHSYGGIIVREFLAGAGIQAIAGLVLVDANQEDTHRKQRFPMAAMDALGHGRNYFEMIGLMDENAFAGNELSNFLRDISTPEALTTASREGTLLLESADSLAARRQLDTQVMESRPVTVIRGDTPQDFARFLSVAREDGGFIGNEDHAAQFEDFLVNRFNVYDRELQVQQLRLSSVSRFVQANNSGHTVIATEPQLIANEILAIWDTTRSRMK